jgi:dephospho-CoA kinase
MPLNNSKTIVVGLTGGIGSGKSSVSKMLHRRFYWPVVDADEMAHQITAPGGKALPKLVEAFGQEVLTEAGELNRGLLRKRMAEDATVKKQLEAIQYPILQQEILDAIAAHRRQGAPVIIYDCPMFFQTRQEQYVDQIVVVVCRKTTRIDRIVARDHIERDLACRMLDLQMDDQEMIRRADLVIDNSRDASILEKNITLIKFNKN